MERKQKKKSLVYVIAYDGTPLMPCEPVVARLILKSKKAKVIKREPFTIKLLYETTKYTQDITLGIDLGSAEIGAAAVDENNNVLFMSQTKIRDNIKEKMDQRRTYRRGRRYRKVRYRKAKWKDAKEPNKKKIHYRKLKKLKSKKPKQKSFISPTVTSKLQAHEHVIREVNKILPVSQIVLETTNFDPHLLKNPTLANPKVRHWGYQKGELYGYDNTKAYVLIRDKYTCQICGKSKKEVKDIKLEVHHIIFRSDGGNDHPENLITLCHNCHHKLHNAKLRGKDKKKAESLSGGKIGDLKHATQMNVISNQLQKHYPDARITYGYVTKHNRMSLNLPKEHYLDAVVIASSGSAVNFKTNVFLRHVCVPKGDYQQTNGKRSEKRLPRGKIEGFIKYDKVKYFGKHYFIKGCMSTGYAVLMNINGEQQKFDPKIYGRKTPKIVLFKRTQARNNWMTETQNIITN